MLQRAATCPCRVRRRSARPGRRTLARAQRRNNSSISSSRGPMQCLEPAGDRTRAQHLPCPYRPCDPSHLDGAEFTVFEEVTEEPPRSRPDHDRVGPGEGLQPRGEVWRVADCADPSPIRSPTTTIPVPMPIRNDSLQFAVAISVTASISAKPARTARVIFMGLRIAEIDQHAIAHILCNETII